MQCVKENDNHHVLHKYLPNDKCKISGNGQQHICLLHGYPTVIVTSKVEFIKTCLMNKSANNPFMSVKLVTTFIIKKYGFVVKHHKTWYWIQATHDTLFMTWEVSVNLVSKYLIELQQSIFSTIMEWEYKQLNHVDSGRDLTKMKMC